MESLWRSNKGMKWSYENILTWPSDWHKEWPFSVQSSPTNIIIGLKALQWRKVSILRKSILGYVKRYPPIGNEVKSQIWLKRWCSAKSYPKNLEWTQNQYYPQNFLLRVVAHLGIPNPSFFLASSNLGDEIPFKGGSLSHPKILECENK
jgi:hypothetical protein